jgi:hypothetical protein
LLAKRSRAYFEKCDAETKQVVTKAGDVVEISNPRPYTIEGLCVHLGIGRDEFRKWLRRDDDMQTAARDIQLRIEENHLVAAARGETNATMAQFILKAYEPEEYVEKKEKENTSSSPLVSIFAVCSGTKIEVKKDE